jgi:hypothetical protein
MWLLPVVQKTLTAPIVLLDLKLLRKHTDGLVDVLAVQVMVEGSELLGLWGENFWVNLFEGRVLYIALGVAVSCVLCAAGRRARRIDSLWAAKRRHQ